MKKTVLFSMHESMQAKMIEFGGTMMPLYFESIQKEHYYVREQVGVFDVSHMGNISIQGKDALRFINLVVSSDIKDTLNQATYGLVLNHDGYTLDDVIVYLLNPDHVFVVCNASNIEKVYDWFVLNKENYHIHIENISDKVSQIAIQGPKAMEYVSKLLPYPYENLSFMESYVIDIEHYFIVSRTGYTGEDGVEIYATNAIILDLYQKVIELGIKPIGLGARDTLRFEACLPLYGHEITESIDPFEAGLSFAVKKEGNFIGSEALFQRKLEPKRRLVAIKLLEKNIPRSPYKVYNEDNKIVGEITTGYLLPTQKDPLALALINTPYHQIDTALKVEIRGNLIPAVVIKKQFMKKNYYKKGA